MHRAGANITAADSSLVDSLMSPAAFSHPVSTTELIETHISWVILTDDYVYKIKKPIVLDFLDFHDLDQRKFYCEEEIRLNQPWAPEIYLDVVPITIVDDQPCFGGKGTAIEYAVRMRRFDDGLRLDEQLERGLLSVADMKELGRNIAARHTAAPVVDENQRDRIVALTKAFIWDNFTALDGFIDSAELDGLHQWTKAELQTLEPVLWQRFDDGFVRDCHGDLHLANLVRLPGGITTFDCIEFNADLRHIDVICDIAFLVMDLVARRRHDLAAHFLNRYLERTGDYAGMSLLSLYFVYRCLVRAKVAAIRCQEREQESEMIADREEAHRYCDMARRQVTQRIPILVVMSGLSGSGKTWVSNQLLTVIPAIRVRSDIERKRLFGLDEMEDSSSEVGKGIYTEQASRQVYESLFSAAGLILAAGHNVILDAAFLTETDRAAAIQIAQHCESVPVILEVSAPIEVMRERILTRTRRAEDASEAGLAVLEHQIATAEFFTPAEQSLVITVDNSTEIDAAKIINEIKELAKTMQVPSLD